MTPCTEYDGYIAPDGYGRHGDTKPERLAHRRAWTRQRGPIPAGLCVLHKCDNRKCVNVDHLFLGTRAENNADRDAKGRHRAVRVCGGDNANAKLTPVKAAEICIRYPYLTMRELAELFNVSQATVHRVVHVTHWTTRGG